MPITAPGRCKQCGKRIKEKRTRCPECDQKERVRQKAMREHYREAGLCTHCGKPRDGELLTCSACRDVKKQSQSKRVRERKAKGLCWMCGAPARPGRTTCRLCAISIAESHRLWREAKDEQGLCRRCGRRKQAPGKHYCQRCLDKDHQWQRARYTRRLRAKEFRAKFKANPDLFAYRFELLMKGKPRQTGTAAD